MKSSRIALYAFAAIVGLGTLSGTTPASALNLSWVNNKPYVDCLKLFYYGDFMAPPNSTPAQTAARKEKGRRYCNRQFYGHD